MGDGRPNATATHITYVDSEAQLFFTEATETPLVDVERGNLHPSPVDEVPDVERGNLHPSAQDTSLLTTAPDQYTIVSEEPTALVHVMDI